MPLKHLPSETQTTLIPSATSLDAQPASRPTEDRIGAYLEAFEKQLGAGVPPAVRKEIREEMRQHIEAQVVANVELGDSPQQALEAALCRFGESAPLARRFRRAHTQREFRAHPFLFLGAPLLWGASLLTAGLVGGREIVTATTEIPGLLLTLAFPLLYCLIYSYFPSPFYQAPKRPHKPILVDLIFPILWYGGNFLAGLIQGGWDGAVGMVSQTPMPVALWCFSLGWLVAPYVRSAMGSGRRKRVSAR